MRIITIILLFSSISLKAQGNIEFIDSLNKHTKELRLKRDDMIPDIFLNSKLNWNDWETKLTKEKKDLYLKKLVGNKFFPAPFDIVREDYHIIDFNGDKLLDVIYAGREPTGGELDNFAFFQNEGDSLHLTLKLLGTIIEIERKDSGSPINFVVWEWPCCAQQVHSIHYYQYYNRNDSIYRVNKDAGHYNVSYGKYQKNNTSNFQLHKQLMYIKSTFLPEIISIDENINFTVRTDYTLMQTNPQKSIEKERMMEYIPEGYDKSIIITKLLKGQQGIILSSLICGEEKFYLIKINCKKVISELNINDTDVENLIGWVKAEDIVIKK